MPTTDERPTTRFRDDAGVEWRVYEIHGAPGVSGPSLVFETDGVIRRVRAYPGDWRTLDAGALARLSWGR